MRGLNSISAGFETILGIQKESFMGTNNKYSAAMELMEEWHQEKPDGLFILGKICYQSY